MTRRNALLLSLLGVLLLAWGMPAAQAQDAPTDPAPSGPVKLTGSGVKAENIVLNCDAVFVGEITAAGVAADSSGSGWTLYSGVEIKVTDILRGSVDHQLTLTLGTQASSGIDETAPKFGDSYIFFVNKNNENATDPYTAIKVLPATDENIAAVKKLIAAAPAPPPAPPAPTTQ